MGGVRSRLLRDRAAGEQKTAHHRSVQAGTRLMSLNAFVIRHPDDNTEAIHTWLLERNRKTFGLSYALDQHGDIFLVGPLPAGNVTAEDIDDLMGSVLENADQVFNHLLEMGFEQAIKAGGAGVSRPVRAPTTSTPSHIWHLQVTRTDCSNPPRRDIDCRGSADWQTMNEEYTPILLRHGESEWNALNLFTGWVDVDLTDKGVTGPSKVARCPGQRAPARRGAHITAAPCDPDDQPGPLEPPVGTWIPVRRSCDSTSATTAPPQGRNKSRL